MSRRHRAPLRAQSHLPTGAAIVSALAIAFIGIGAVGVSAGPPSGALRLTADQARAAGLGLSLVSRPDLAPGLVELLPEGGAAPRLLAVAPTGEVVATADRIGPDPAVLSIVGSDGSQARLDLPGVLAAAFAPDASWLAVADGTGQLWRIEADGSRRLVAPGPFIGPLSVTTTNAVLALAVSSVEAPFVSRLVMVDVDNGALNPLSDEQLVYGATRLADGGVAVVSHRPTGTVVQVLRGPRATLLADLGPGAVNVAVAASGTAIAWERSGAVYLRDMSSGRVTRIGTGSNPAFSPDGATFLVTDGGLQRLLGSDGSVRATLDTPAGFVACGEGCAS